MRFMTVKSILAAIVLTTAALSTHAAKAETNLNVPFNFTVAGQTMPAGVYTVQQDIFHNMVTLRNKDASRSFAYVLRPGDPTSNEVHVSLKFQNSGEGHILQSIQVGSRTTTRLDAPLAPGNYEPARLSQGR
jgi:hypothetical protein